MTVRIDAMQPSDWTSVRSVFEEGIATGIASLETEAPDYESWDRAHHRDCRLVGRDGDGVVGWAALSPVSPRRVYRGVAEVSVYVAARARGRGVGKALLSALVESSESAGIWTLQAGIFAGNRISIALHESCGFRVVGVRERLGCLRGEWRDIVLMERRSGTVGA